MTESMDNAINTFYKQSINNELMKQLRIIINSKKIDFNKIILLFVLFGVDTLKENINNVIKYLLENITIYIKKYINKIKKYIKNKYTVSNNISLANIKFNESKIKKIYINKISISKSLYNLLCEYIITNKYSNCNYNEISNSIYEKENSEFCYTSEFDQIKIQYKEYIINIYEFINCEYYKHYPSGKISNVKKINQYFKIQYIQIEWLIIY